MRCAAPNITMRVTAGTLCSQIAERSGDSDCSDGRRAAACRDFPRASYPASFKSVGVRILLRRGADIRIAAGGMRSEMRNLRCRELYCLQKVLFEEAETFLTFYPPRIMAQTGLFLALRRFDRRTNHMLFFD